MNDIAYIIPLIVLDLLLAIISLIHVLKHPNYKFGNKVLWVIVVLFLQLIGPILYFVIGKGDDE